jgi:hypothetical protein
MTIINDDSSVITKLETSLTDDARVVIYDCHMFIVQATVAKKMKLPNFHFSFRIEWQFQESSINPSNVGWQAT